MSSNVSHPKYRPDIDGLRAIAVLSVVVYHAFPKLLRGGFAGVDVFFVLSGFLISTILFQNIDHGSLSIRDFYSRRIRRIFPALILVLFFVLFLGWFCLFPEEYKQLGKHAVASSGFIQNFALWKESGYFDNSSEAKPLLHIWSLGIEEQFYFVWPLFLLGVSKFSGILEGRYKRLFYLVATVLVFVVSFILNLDLVKVDQIKTFYLPQYRFFELALGGILSWLVLYQSKISIPVSKRLVENILSFVGLAILLVVFGTFSKETVFPGANALLPIFATTFIIGSGPHSWISRKILSNKILVWFGLISFPLYLWHWPLLSLARIVKGEEPSSLSICVILLVGVFLSWITYNFVEKNIRFNQNRKIVRFLCGLLIVVFIAGQYIKVHGGIEGRALVSRNLPQTGFDGDNQGNLIDGCGLNKEILKKFPEGGCRHDKRGVPSIALIGDSKSAVLVNGLVRYSDTESRVLYIGGTGKFGAVDPYNSISYSKDRDTNLHNPLLDLAVQVIIENKNIKVVVMDYATRAMFRLKTDQDILGLPGSENFDFAYKRTSQLVKDFIRGGKKVVILVDNPTLPEPTTCMDRNLGIDFIDKWREREKIKRRCQIGYDKHLELSKKYRDLLNRIKNENTKNVEIFDTVPLLCDMKNRICSMTLNERRLYSYSDHISDYAAGIIGSKLIPFIRDFTENKK